MQKSVNGQLIDLTQDEIDAIDAEQAAGKEARLLAALATHRYDVETGGVIVSGSRIQTDRESRANLDAARTVAIEAKAFAGLMASDPEAAAAYPQTAKTIYERALAEGITWKTVNGFVTLPLDPVILVANAAFDFVQRCFLAEKTVTDAVDSYDTPAEIIAAFDAAMAS